MSLMSKTLVLDPDAAAFITAASITEFRQKSAINDLVIGLKADGIWSKFKAIYPFVGGTATSHKFNLRDPRNLSAAYVLNFQGGWTHDARGITGNGINTYADTYYTGFLGMMGFYTPSGGYPLAYGYYQNQEGCDSEGCWSNPAQRGYLSSIGAQLSCCYWPSTSPGFYGEGLGQIGNTSGYKNGIKIADAQNGFNVINLPLGAIRDIYFSEGGSIYGDYLFSYTSGTQSFSYFSNVELTVIESANLYTRVQAFQTALGRQIANIPVSDPDAFRYLNNSGIRNPETSLIEMTALNTLAVELKAQNIWSKMTDIFPFLTDTRNIFNYSEIFTNAYWVKNNIGIIANSTTDPNNTTTASSFVESAVSSSHTLYVSSGLTLSPEKYTTSVYLKKSSRDWAYISMFNAATANTFYGYFNLATGTVGTVTSGATATIVDAGNGWYRCTLTRTMSTYNGADACAIGSASADNTPNYLGNGTTAMFIWGAQLEFGLTATSYQVIGYTSSQRIQNQFSGNLKEPNLTLTNFQGGWTFSRTGAKGNGINAWVQPQRNFNSTFTSGNLHISVYSKMGIIPDRLMSLWGAHVPFSPYGYLQATFMNVAEQYYTPYNMQMSLGGFGAATLQMLNTKGLIMTSATNAGTNGARTYQNGALRRVDFAGTGLPTYILFNAYYDYNYGNNKYAPFELSFISTGLGLTVAEAATFNTIVANYQTALSRQADLSTVAPVNTAAPVITGNPLVGQTLTSSTGTWTSPTTPNFYYRWFRNGFGDTGITTSTYVLTSSDWNTNITCKVTAISIDGYSSPVTSNSLLINQAATNTSTPFISGQQQVGSTLTATTGSWSGNTPITFAYQWKKNGSNIVGATSSTYVLVAGDAGASTTIQCVLTGTNSYGSGTGSSNTLTNIAPAFPANTIAPVISGTQRVGQVLTTTNGSWTGITPITYTYQWKKNGSNIGGATAQTYTLVSGDLGAGTTIQCVVTGTNAYGNGTGNSNILTGVGAALPVVSDANAQAFINAADIPDVTQANAINNLVIGLKADNLWTSLDDIYPFVGGTATSHKWNLKSPTGNQLTFYGGITHDSNGITGNGSNGWAYTNNANARSYGVYSRTANPTGTFIGKQRYTQGDEDSYDWSYSMLFPDSFQGGPYGSYMNFGTNAPYDNYYSIVGGDTGAANELKLYRKGINILPTASGNLTPWYTDTPFTLLATTVRYYYWWDSSQYGEYQAYASNANIAFAHFTTTLLNATQNANLFARIRTFQQALGRAVFEADPDAQAFITAAAITDTTQQTAVNNLVVGLKADGLWTKMKAIYPFVGGTASSHKFNLKDPRDTNDAFRLVFFGGITHNANGMTCNGTNGYANTLVKLTDGVSALGIPRGANHWSSYNRSMPTAPSTGGQTGMADANDPSKFFGWGVSLSQFYFGGQNYFGTSIAAGTGLLMLSTENFSNTVYTSLYLNGTSLGSVGSGFSNNWNLNSPYFFLGTLGISSGSPTYNNTNYAFLSLGDTINTAGDITNFNTRVQAFQSTLGRLALDTNAQAFVTAAGITNTTQMLAIDNLVKGLKADGLWTKIQALYPFVGGTASSHKFNLKDPRDTDDALRLQFFGGWTHDANGITGNGTNTYANTFARYQGGNSYGYTILNDNNHWSTYQTTIGTATGYNGLQEGGFLFGFTTGLSTKYVGLQNFANTGLTESVGFWNGTVQSQSFGALYKNGASVYTISQAYGSSSYNQFYIIGSSMFNGNIIQSVNARFALSSIGIGLTSTNAANFNTRVQAFQAALGRQV